MQTKFMNTEHIARWQPRAGSPGPLCFAVLTSLAMPFIGGVLGRNTAKSIDNSRKIRH